MLELAFPEAENSIAFRASDPPHPPVPALVARDLCGPVPCISLRQMTAPAAAMPETSVHENGDSLSLEDEVGRSDAALSADVPPPQLCTNEERTQTPLGSPVTS